MISQLRRYSTIVTRFAIKRFIPVKQLPLIRNGRGGGQGGLFQTPCRYFAEDFREYENEHLVQPEYPDDEGGNDYNDEGSTSDEYIDPRLFKLPILNDLTKQHIYAAHITDPEKWSIKKLSNEFGTSLPRTQAVIVLMHKRYEMMKEMGLIVNILPPDKPEAPLPSFIKVTFNETILELLNYLSDPDQIIRAIKKEQSKATTATDGSAATDGSVAPAITADDNNAEEEEDDEKNGQTLQENEKVEKKKKDAETRERESAEEVQSVESKVYKNNSNVDEKIPIEDLPGRTKDFLRSTRRHLKPLMEYIANHDPKLKPEDLVHYIHDLQVTCQQFEVFIKKLPNDDDLKNFPLVVTDYFNAVRTLHRDLNYFKHYLLDFTNKEDVNSKVFIYKEIAEHLDRLCQFPSTGDWSLVVDDEDDEDDNSNQSKRPSLFNDRKKARKSKEEDFTSFFKSKSEKINHLLRDIEIAKIKKLPFHDEEKELRNEIDSVFQALDHLVNIDKEGEAIIQDLAALFRYFKPHLFIPLISEEEEKYHEMLEKRAEEEQKWAIKRAELAKEERERELAEREANPDDWDPDDWDPDEPEDDGLPYDINEDDYEVTPEDLIRHEAKVEWRKSRRALRRIKRRDVLPFNEFVPESIPQFNFSKYPKIEVEIPNLWLELYTFYQKQVPKGEDATNFKPDYVKLAEDYYNQNQNDKEIENDHNDERIETPDSTNTTTSTATKEESANGNQDQSTITKMKRKEKKNEAKGEGKVEGEGTEVKLTPAEIEKIIVKLKDHYRRMANVEAGELQGNKVRHDFWKWGADTRFRETPRNIPSTHHGKNTVFANYFPRLLHDDDSTAMEERILRRIAKETRAKISYSNVYYQKRAEFNQKKLKPDPPKSVDFVKPSRWKIAYRDLTKKKNIGKGFGKESATIITRTGKFRRPTPLEELTLSWNETPVPVQRFYEEKFNFIREKAIDPFKNPDNEDHLTNDILQTKLKLREKIREEKKAKNDTKK